MKKKVEKTEMNNISKEREDIITDPRDIYQDYKEIL